MPHSCAQLGGFAIGARIALLWQHNANAKCQRAHACTRSMPSYNGVKNCITARRNALRRRFEALQINPGIVA